jgi:hypothetical protein
MIFALIIFISAITYLLVGFASICIMSMLADKANVKEVAEAFEDCFCISLFFWPFFIIFFVGESVGSTLKKLYEKVVSK